MCFLSSGWGASSLEVLITPEELLFLKSVCMWRKMRESCKWMPNNVWEEWGDVEVQIPHPSGDLSIVGEDLLHMQYIRMDFTYHQEFGLLWKYGKL